MGDVCLSVKVCMCVCVCMRVSLSSTGCLGYGMSCMSTHESHRKSAHLKKEHGGQSHSVN